MFRKRIINSHRVNTGPSQILPYNKSLRTSLEEVADCTSDGTEDSGLFIIPVPSDAITLDFYKPTNRNDSSSPNPHNDNGRSRDKTTPYGEFLHHVTNETPVDQPIVSTGSSIGRPVVLRAFIDSPNSSTQIPSIPRDVRFDSVRSNDGDNGVAKELLNPPSPPANGRSGNRRPMKVSGRNSTMMDHTGDSGNHYRESGISRSLPPNDSEASGGSTGKRVMGVHTMDNLVRFFGGKSKSRKTDDPVVVDVRFDSEARESRVVEHKTRLRHDHDLRLNRNGDRVPADVDSAMDELRGIVSSSIDGIDSLMVGLHDDPFHSSAGKWRWFSTLEWTELSSWRSGVEAVD